MPMPDRPVAQHGVGERGPSRAPPTPRTRRLRAGTSVPRRKVPQRSLPALRLVDREQLVVAERRGSRATSRSTTTASGRARRPRLRAARPARRRQRSVAAPSVARSSALVVSSSRGQMCPSGSIGKSHSGHVGRPASTAATPLRAIARTCATRRVQARDVAFALVERRAVLPRRRPASRAARSAPAGARGRSRSR